MLVITQKEMAEMSTLMQPEPSCPSQIVRFTCSQKPILDVQLLGMPFPCPGFYTQNPAYIPLNVRHLLRSLSAPPEVEFTPWFGKLQDSTHSSDSICDML